MENDRNEEVTSLFASAESLIVLKKFQDAVRLYTDWIDRESKISDPTIIVNSNLVAKLYNNRGHAKYLQVDFDGALEDYNESLKYDSNHAYAYYNRGTIYYRMGNFKAAESDMKIACELNPESEEFQLALKRSTEQIESLTTATEPQK